MLFKIKNRKQKVASGLSLVDVIIATAFIAIVFTALAGAFLSAIELSAHQKARIGAVAISNQRMELIRNLPYDDVGTVSGIPGGNIPQNENISLNGINYTRRVLIQYVDDPKDGTGALDTNGLTADYKRVKIETSWTIKGNTRSNILISNIVPKGIETVAGGGTLIINVFDALGSPIPSADVSIINSITNPPISINTFTDINGRVTFPGSPSASSYEIIVTNSGYSTAQTYYADTANPNPNPGHLTVIAGDTTVSSFSI
ncbi:MAG TPA: carboxypeptidase regulatory-like domain-containing protein, partial [Candidatus Yonathbacteria bacterium]|nr:carboxypeptidase regulatory-like domain-containing protein [Candidatus Yonathbacteria bacterium]